MATAWVRSLQCKSNAVDDVYQPKKTTIPLSSCGGASSRALKDVVFFFPKNPSRRPMPPQPPPSPPRSEEKSERRHRSKPKHRPKPPLASPSPPPPPRAFPTLAELPAGHSSRRVVEIIFSSSWSPRPAPFEIEMLFRVHSPPRVAARFEDYRAAVRSRSGGADARCAADGNEMMRFHCGPRSGGAAVYDAGVVPCTVAGPGGRAVEAIRTFSGSGGAHESAAGAGRRAMLVCRVIAGRIRSESDRDPEGESVCVGPGELLVFDPRAVLPCFLIIYKVKRVDN